MPKTRSQLREEALKKSPKSEPNQPQPREPEQILEAEDDDEEIEARNNESRRKRIQELTAQITNLDNEMLSLSPLQVQRSTLSALAHTKQDIESLRTEAGKKFMALQQAAETIRYKAGKLKTDLNELSLIFSKADEEYSWCWGDYCENILAEERKRATNRRSVIKFTRQRLWIEKCQLVDGNEIDPPGTPPKHNPEHCALGPAAQNIIAPTISHPWINKFRVELHVAFRQFDSSLKEIGTLVKKDKKEKNRQTVISLYQRNKPATKAILDNMEGLKLELRRRQKSFRVVEKENSTLKEQGRVFKAQLQAQKEEKISIANQHEGDTLERHVRSLEDQIKSQKERKTQSRKTIKKLRRKVEELEQTIEDLRTENTERAADGKSKTPEKTTNEELSQLRTYKETAEREMQILNTENMKISEDILKISKNLRISNEQVRQLTVLRQSLEQKIMYLGQEIKSVTKWVESYVWQDGTAKVDLRIPTETEPALEQEVEEEEGEEEYEDEEEPEEPDDANDADFIG